MYEAKIWWATRCGDAHHAYLHLMQTSTGKRPTFAVVARTDGREAVAEAAVPDYPIWSESTLGLAARALSIGGFRAKQLIYAGPLVNWSLPENQVSSLDVSVALLPSGPGSPRELEGVHMGIKSNVLAYQYRRGAFESDFTECEFTAPTEDACVIALGGLCELLWGTATVGPMPAAVTVRTHRRGKTNYILTSDIPEHARHEFLRYLEFIDTPVIPTEPHRSCAHAQDWEDFLTGKNRYETGFVPGVRFRTSF